VTRLALNQLVTAGQLAVNEDGRPAEWIVPPVRDHAPNPPSGYMVSFVRFHERGFMAPASRFMRSLCHHYGVELHNFWRLWIHLFRGGDVGAEDSPRGARRRHVARLAGSAQGRLHPLHHDDQQCRLGAGVVLPLQ
jgi:hypothetical protein